jgi:hypothetical protein
MMMSILRQLSWQLLEMDKQACVPARNTLCVSELASVSCARRGVSASPRVWVGHFSPWPLVITFNRSSACSLESSTRCLGVLCSPGWATVFFRQQLQLSDGLNIVALWTNQTLVQPAEQGGTLVCCSSYVTAWL